MEVEVPLDNELRDYSRRLDELARLLADFEGLGVDETIEALTSPSADMLRFRFTSDLVATGSIPFVDGIRLREAQKGMILAAAHSTLEPRGHFARMSMKPAVKLLTLVREGQTARGSYISRLLIPLRPPLGQLELDSPPPWERRVTTTLMRGLAVISRFVDAGTPEELVDKAAEGVSANLLTALAALRPPGSIGTVDISMHWSDAWSAPMGTRHAVRFSDRQFETLEPVAELIRSRQESIQYEAIGFIGGLKRKDASQAGGPGQVTVIVPRDDLPGKTLRVRIQLSGEEYTKAVEAHRQARRIKVIGTLKKEGRIWLLRDPSPIRVIGRDDGDDDDDDDDDLGFVPDSSDSRSG